MAKSLSVREAKALVKKYKELDGQLSSIIASREEMLEEIASETGKMLEEGAFASYAEQDIAEPKDWKDDPAVYGLMHRITGLIRLLPVIREASDLRAATRKDCAGWIRDLDPVLHMLRWLFVNRENKRRAEEAFVKLSALIDDGWSLEVPELVSRAGEARSYTGQEVIDTFEGRNPEYRAILQRIITAHKLTGKHSEALEDMIRFFSDIDGKAADASSAVEKRRQDVRTAAGVILEGKVTEILKDIPIEKLSDEKRGFRIKALKDHGFDTIEDICRATETDIAAVYGISWTGASEIKAVGRSYAKQAEKGVRIQLNADEKTKENTELVRAIFLYLRKSEEHKRVDDLYSGQKDVIRRGISLLGSVGSGEFWLMRRKGDRAAVRAAWRELRELKFEGFGTDIIEAAEKVCEGITVTDEQAWEDFEKNSPMYFAALEEIMPGVLGGGEDVVGLPEELAKDVAQESFALEGLKCRLRRYQEWGVKYILHQGKVLLGDEMGLGKTIQAIAVMVALRNAGATHFLIVCPASVLSNWCREIRTHSDLEVIQIYGAARAEAYARWRKQGGAAVTTYETTAHLEPGENERFSLLVVDEAHYVKNQDAQRSMNVARLSRHAERLLFMTGTALENRVDEMVSLISFLRPDIAEEASKITYLSGAPQFRDLVAPVYYRRRREEVLGELPDLIEKTEWCVLSEEEEEIYEDAVLSRNFNLSRRVSWNIPDIRKSAKAKRMLELIDEAAEDGRKVIVFTYYLETARKICELLGDRCTQPINGSVPVLQRQQILDDFEKAPAGKVLVSQILAGGTGLNIQAASVVIICEPQLKPSIENQAISRTYRMGQTRKVLVFRLVCDDTIDERIMDMLQNKQDVFDAFADRSASAEAEKDVEIDEKTLGMIIEEEVDRIKAKKATSG